MKQILLIEDEKPFARFVELELRHEGFAVCCAYDGESGWELTMSQDWDLILLDVMLPGIQGTELCRMIRSRSQIPIIMITARDAVTDRIEGLDSGADDYIPKPFAIVELLARMRAVFRRAEAVKSGCSSLSFRDISMDVETMSVTKGGRKVELTKREFDMLWLLLREPGQVITRDRFLDEIWGTDTQVETSIIDVYIRYIRSKLHPDGELGCIQTVRGAGYMLQ